MRPRRLAVVAACALAVLAPGCGRGPSVESAPDAGAPVAASPATPVAAGHEGLPGRPLTDEQRLGETIYRRENCSRCHTLFAAPPAEGPVTLPVPELPSALGSRVGPDLGFEGHRRSDDWHHAHLYAPGVLVPGSRMPASRHLFRPGAGGRPEPTGDARALVAWLQTLGRSRRDVWAEFRRREPEIPAPGSRPDAARLAEGMGLYRRHCAACHGEDGNGDGPAAALLERAPRDFTAAAYRFRSTMPGEPPNDADLFRVITLGTGAGAAMPGFAHLGAEERWALVRVLREFSPALRGRALGDGAGPAVAGAGAGTSGPVPGPPPPKAQDMAAAGAALYRELGCASCHGADAAGRPAPEGDGAWRDESGRPIPGTGDLRHACGRRAGASDDAIDRALRYGVGPVMPSYAPAIEGRPWAATAIGAWLRSVDPEAAPGGPAPTSGP